MSQSHQNHSSYWDNEKQIDFFDYERNPALIPLFKPNELVLDLGCGDGAVGEYWRQKTSSKIIGLDFSHTALTRAQKRKVIPIQSNIDHSLPIQSNSVDTVFFGDVIEHIYSPKIAIQEIHRVLKTGGRLILSCPNMGYWRYRIHYLLHGLFPETEWIEPELYNSQHIRFFNKQLLYQILDKYHFQPTQFIGVSRRRLDQPFLKKLPSLFGMIMLVEAIKTK